MKNSIVGLLIAVSIVSASDLAESLFLKGNFYHTQGKDSVACKYYEMAIREEPTSLTLQETYGRSLIGAKRVNEGTKILRDVSKELVTQAEKTKDLNEWEKAEDMYRDIYRTTAWSMDGNALGYILYTDGIRNNDSSKILLARKAWNSLASIAVRAKKLDDADETLALFLDKMPQDANAWALKGAVCSLREDYQGSFKYLLQAVQLDSTNYLAWYTLGSSFERASLSMSHSDKEVSIKAAVKSFEHALTIRPGDTLSLNYLKYIKDYR